MTGPDCTTTSKGATLTLGIRSWFLPAGRLAARTTSAIWQAWLRSGHGSSLTGVEPVLTLANLYLPVTSVLIDGVGHYPWVEQPSDFRGAVDPFCTVAVATGTADRPNKGAGSRGGGVTR